RKLVPCSRFCCTATIGCSGAPSRSWSRSRSAACSSRSRGRLDERRPGEESELARLRQRETVIVLVANAIPYATTIAVLIILGSLGRRARAPGRIGRGRTVPVAVRRAVLSGSKLLGLPGGPGPGGGGG